MARTIAVIKQQILDQIAANATLSGFLISPSKTSIWNNWVYIVAVCQNLFEQLQDVFVKEIEGYIMSAGIGTTSWLNAQILKFQYSPTVAQYIQLDLNSFQLFYPVVNPALRILTRCSVVSNGSGALIVLVAKQEPPVALINSEITALNAYINQIQFCGKQINVLSKNADNLTVAGYVYFDGQYSSIINASVVNALIAYCANLSSTSNFGSAVYVKDVENAILAVKGVTDVNLTEISLRADGIAYASRYQIYNLSTSLNNRLASPASGYVLQETTSTKDFATTLQFIAQ